MVDAEHESFLSRWSQRKAQARSRPAAPAPEVPQPLPEAAPARQPSALPSLPVAQCNAKSGEPPPTLADVARLTRESDFARFVASGVESDVKNAALKKLFSDPHFNLMDGLDVYIDDYTRPDPLPDGMLLKIAQAKFLGLSSQATEEDGACRPDPMNHGTIEVEPASAAVDPPPKDKIASNEDTDLQLQPYDAAGRAGTEPGLGEDSGREH